MAREKGFEIDRRVAIAMDALTPKQQEGLGQVLRDKAHFIQYASVPGRTQRLLAKEPVYKMKVGSSGLRLIYSVVGDDIAVLDVMHKTTMDRFGSRKYRRRSAGDKG
jgi:hypothetical protein